MPSAFTREVAAIITGYLARRGREQQELAAAVGVSPAQISRMLRGQKHWDVEQLDRACTFLNIDLVAVLREAEQVVKDEPGVGGSGDTSLTDEFPVLTADELAQRDLGLAAHTGRPTADQEAPDDDNDARPRA